jgi:hypothetical protein
LEEKVVGSCSREGEKKEWVIARERREIVKMFEL